jgi:hypothetical protein
MPFYPILQEVAATHAMRELLFKNLKAKVGIFQLHRRGENGFSKNKNAGDTLFFCQHFTYFYSIFHIFTRF